MAEIDAAQKFETLSSVAVEIRDKGLSALLDCDPQNATYLQETQLQDSWHAIRQNLHEFVLFQMNNAELDEYEIRNTLL